MFVFIISFLTVMFFLHVQGCQILKRVGNGSVQQMTAELQGIFQSQTIVIKVVEKEKKFTYSSCFYKIFRVGGGGVRMSGRVFVV